MNCYGDFRSCEILHYVLLGYDTMHPCVSYKTSHEDDEVEQRHNSPLALTSVLD